MHRLAIAAVFIAACIPQHYALGMLDVEMDRAGGNHCSVEHAPEAAATLQAVQDAARELGYWRDCSSRIRLCIITSRPHVMCTGHALAGCTYRSSGGATVYIARRYAPRAQQGNLSLSDGDWRHTLVHELTGALAAGRCLTIPFPTDGDERAWTQRDDYQRLTAAARTRLR